MGISEQQERIIAQRAELAEKYPENPEAWSNLGQSYLEAGAFDAALLGFERAVQLGPSVSEFHYNLGVAHQRMSIFEEAMSCYRRALELDNSHGGAWNNIGIVLKQLGNPVAALAAGQQAVENQPDNADFQWTLSLTELLLGRYDDGFERYEWRRRIPGYKGIGGIDWNGEMASDKELVVYCEQGFGDAFNFIRFIDEARLKVSKVTLQCRDQLIPLLKSGFSGADAIEPIGKVSDETLTVPAMSLPHVLGMTDRLGMDEPYLRAGDELRLNWKHLFPPDKLNVGICWQGNPSHRGDSERSVSLAMFESLFEVPNCRFFSLQKRDGMDQLERRLDLPVVNLGKDLDNEQPFVDTAAVLKELDLLITVDTSLAHLAGALGADVWLLLAPLPDYRWGLADQPWYPTMETYRKTMLDDWSEVMTNIKGDLKSRSIRQKENK